MTKLQLPHETEQKLKSVSKMRQTLSPTLIEEAPESFLFDQIPEKTDVEDSYELGKPYFGKYGSGNGDLSTDYKKLLTGKLRAKLHTD
jgi:hypothetical protein